MRVGDTFLCDLLFLAPNWARVDLRNNDASGLAASDLVKLDLAETRESVAALILLLILAPPPSRAGREFNCSWILRTRNQGQPKTCVLSDALVQVFLLNHP